mmetsp:Transcript_62217/g.110629  ORF Transcript_62217/g.110629 Transcript_62217/m.110629 type:complete len:459 (-) Transcript_62217:168-1544(-)
MSTLKNLYAELHLQPTASTSEIRTAYRRAALLAHPDKGGSSAAFHSVVFAFEVLSCPASRAIYDKSMNLYHQPSTERSMHASTAKFPPRTSVKRKKTQSVAPHTLPSARNREARTEEDLASGDAEDVPAPEPDHEDDATRLALEHLRAAVHALPVPHRKAMISRMPQDVRAELLTHMISDITSKQGPAPPRLIKHGPKRVRGWESQTRGTDVRAVTRMHKTTYLAQLRLRHLRMYTRAQDDIEAAVGHQMVLARARHSIDAAGDDIWHDPAAFCSVFSDACRNAGSSLEKLGLSVFVFMRADEWISRPATITSPVMALKDAVATHSRLCKARHVSWEQLRAEWLPLMIQTQHSRSRQLSWKQAMAVADRARAKLLERQFWSAVASAERTLKSQRCREAKRAKARKQAELRAHKQKLAAAASMRRSAAEKRQEWAARRRWYRNRDLTMEEIMQGPPQSL